MRVFLGYNRSMFVDLLSLVQVQQLPTNTIVHAVCVKLKLESTTTNYHCRLCDRWNLCLLFDSGREPRRYRHVLGWLETPRLSHRVVCFWVPRGCWYNCGHPDKGNLARGSYCRCGLWGYWRVGKCMIYSSRRTFARLSWMYEFGSCKVACGTVPSSQYRTWSLHLGPHQNQTIYSYGFSRSEFECNYLPQSCMSFKFNTVLWWTLSAEAWRAWRGITPFISSTTWD